MKPKPKRWFSEIAERLRGDELVGEYYVLPDRVLRTVSIDGGPSYWTVKDGNPDRLCVYSRGRPVGYYAITMVFDEEPRP